MVPMNRVRGHCVGRDVCIRPCASCSSDGAFRLARPRSTHHIVAVLLSALLAGCGNGTDGTRILEDLRSDGLLRDDVDEPAPQLQPTEMQRSWSFPVEGELSLACLREAADRLNPRIAAARARIGTAGARARHGHGTG